MKQSPKNFILLVEILDRELPAAVLLGSELVHRGHNVWLIEKGRFRKSPASFAPSIVLEKGLTKGCLPRFRAIRNAGHVVVVMCQEGFIYRSGEDYVRRRVWADTMKNVDCLLLWGERQKNDLAAFLRYPGSFHVTGNPRMDLLHPRFRAVWREQEAAIRREHGDFVLFTTRFGAVNHFRRSFDDTVDRRKEQYTDGADETVPGRLESLQTLFSAYMEGIAEVAARLPDIRFVVRPHPIENVEVWADRFANAANVKVSDIGPSVPWLLAASRVVHNACTTGIEAYLLGTPVTEFQPASIPRGEFDPILPGKVTGTCDSVQNLCDWITAQSGNEKRPETSQDVSDVLGHYLHNDSEPNSYRHIADAIERLETRGGWARLLNTLSTQHDAEKMKKRYIDIEEVNRLLRSYATCNLGYNFTPAGADDVGIRLWASSLVSA